MTTATATPETSAQQEAEQDLSVAVSISDIELSDELAESFATYAHSVITSRAIPDVRDGLKPVQRRIVYSMLRSGSRHDGRYRKSARVVGDVMGRYHPHGDSAIYDALVQLGQPFKRMMCLVDPQGNFGSIDDPPAASRYTECRLAQAAQLLTGNIDEGTVDFRPAYDGIGQEPVVLPAQVPSLFINGAEGIAVGMATKIASHNPTEVISAAKAYIAAFDEDREFTVSDLLTHVRGPDFPEGGLIVASAEDLRNIYTTGKGAVRLRAKCALITAAKGRSHISITELPFGVGAETVVKRIQTLRSQGRFSDVSQVADLSDLNGTQLRVDLARGADPEKIMAGLYRSTPLETRFNFNTVALDAQGKPTATGYVPMLAAWADHRREVIRRRARHRRDRAAARLHIVQGLLAALAAVHKVIDVITKAETDDACRAQLKELLQASDKQIDAILRIRLGRLSAMSAQQLRSEASELVAEIETHNELLIDTRKQSAMMISELDDAKQMIGKLRCARLVSPEDARSPFGVQKPVCVTVTDSGQLTATVRRPRNATFAVNVNPYSYVQLLQADGTLRLVRPDKLPSRVQRTDEPAGKLPVLAVSADGTTCDPAGVVASDDASAMDVVLVTRQGTLKRVNVGDLLEADDGSPFLRLADDNDRIAHAFTVTDVDSSEMVSVSSAGRVLRFPVSAIPRRGLAAGPVAGMKLGDDDQLRFAGAVTDDMTLGLVCADGRVKVTHLSEFATKKSRVATGVLFARLPPKERATISVIYGCVTEDETLRCLDANGDSLGVVESSPRQRPPVCFEGTVLLKA